MKVSFFSRHSIKTKVTLLTLIIFVVSLWTLSYYASRMLQDDLQRMLGEQQFSTASLVAEHISDALDERRVALELVAGQIDAQLIGRPTVLQAHLEQHQILASLFNGGVFATGADGTAIADMPLLAGRIGTNYMDRESVSVPLKDGKTVIGRPAMGKKLGAPIFSITAPVRDGAGEVIGTLVGTINLGLPNFLDQITRTAYGKHGSYLLVAPAQRMVITASDKRRALEVLPAAGVSPTLDRFIDGYEGSEVFVNPLGLEVLASVRSVPVAGWYFAVVTPTADAFAPIHAMQQRMLWTTLALTLLAGALTWWTLRRQLAPMSAVINTLATQPESDQISPLPLTNSDGEIGALIASFNRLLSTLQVREKKLTESELRWQFAVEGAGDGLWDWDVPTNTVFFSPRWKEMLGFAQDEIGGTLDEWRKRTHPDDLPRVLADAQAHFDGQTPVYANEHRILCKDGSWKWILARGLVVSRDAAGKPLRMIGTHSDITGRKESEVALQRAMAAAEAANQSKSRFLAAASHDLRQPMAALALYTNVLRKAVKPGQEKLVSQVQHCVNSLSAMLNDLLDVSKLDAGVMVPHVTVFSIDRLCASLAAIYAPKAARKGLRLRWRLAAGVTLQTDQQMLHRMVGNLIDNALAYTAQGGVLVATRRHGGALWLEIWDTGVGMRQEQIPHIFEEFMQLGDNARNRGSGLGLSIVAKAAALLGLEIRVRSRPGRGSVFCLSLPEGGAPASVQPPTVQAISRFTIGLVEDNPMVLDSLVQALQAWGHTVFAGASGAQVLEQLGENTPDIMVCDYRLGDGETGLDVIAAARARFGPRLPAIILTGDTDSEQLTSIAATSIRVYPKPVPGDLLQAHVHRAVKGA